MLSRWREGVSPETAHIRELAGLPGTGHQHGLPIQSHAHTIRDAIETKPICAVRSPPGSGKTMILPELLHEAQQPRAHGLRVRGREQPRHGNPAEVGHAELGPVWGEWAGLVDSPFGFS